MGLSASFAPISGGCVVITPKDNLLGVDKTRLYLGVLRILSDGRMGYECMTKHRVRVHVYYCDMVIFK